MDGGGRERLEHVLENGSVREGLNKLQNLFSRHSGVGQNPVKNIVYKHLEFSGSFFHSFKDRVSNIFREI